MKIKLKVIEISAGGSRKVVADLEVQGLGDDELRRKARDLLAARDVRSISRGPRGLIAYIVPRGQK